MNHLNLVEIYMKFALYFCIRICIGFSIKSFLISNRKRWHIPQSMPSQSLHCSSAISNNFAASRSSLWFMCFFDSKLPNRSALLASSVCQQKPNCCSLESLGILKSLHNWLFYVLRVQNEIQMNWNVKAVRVKASQWSGVRLPRNSRSSEEVDCNPKSGNALRSNWVIGNSYRVIIMTSIDKIINSSRRHESFDPADHWSLADLINH